MPTRRVSPQEARTMMEQEGFRYVDVRSTAEFTAGHPSESYNVPVANSGPGGMTPNPDFVAVMEASFPHDAKLVIGCMAGGRSARACAMLEQAGYTPVSYTHLRAHETKANLVCRLHPDRRSAGGLRWRTG